MTAGRKDDGGKLPWDLLPWESTEAVVAVLRSGAGKYAADNWKHVPDARRRYFAAAIRHLVARWRGEVIDPEFGHPHLAHAACCVLFMLWFDLRPSATEWAPAGAGEPAEGVRESGV